ncbi:MAG: helix-turn-helix domain-containing protein [Anaeroplasmataceae bacterium]|nr:helix-turn-helix domain-containing protein [Anaeroplasmataceae bacterium]
MNNLKIGSFLQALRKAKGLTQADIAEYFEISPKTVSKWECGDALPEVPMLKALAEYYEVTVDEILNGEKGVLSSSKTKKDNEEFFFNQKKKRLTLFFLIAFSSCIFALLLNIFLANLFDELANIDRNVAFAIYLPCVLVSLVIFIIGLYMVGSLDEDFNPRLIESFRYRRFTYCYIFTIVLLLSLGWSYFFDFPLNIGTIKLIGIFGIILLVLAIATILIYKVLLPKLKSKSEKKE